MALPALATPSDLADWLGQTISDDDARALAVLATASTLVRARAGENWVDAEGELEEDIPDGIGQVVVMAAARVWHNPTSASQLDTGPFSGAWRHGFELTPTEADMVDAAIGSTKVRGLGTISTTRGELETRDVWVDVEGGQQIEVAMPGESPYRNPW